MSGRRNHRPGIPGNSPGALAQSVPGDTPDGPTSPLPQALILRSWCSVRTGTGPGKSHGGASSVGPSSVPNCETLEQSAIMEPSTKTGEARDVDLTPDLAALLRRYLTWLRSEALQKGQGEPERLFSRPDGTVMDKDHAAGAFRKILKTAKLAGHRMYDCRHTYDPSNQATGHCHLGVRGSRGRYFFSD